MLDIIFGNENVTYEPSQYANLKVDVAEVLGRKQGRNAGWGMGDAQLNEPDATILQEVFWDLIVERVLPSE